MHCGNTVVSPLTQMRMKAAQMVLEPDVAMCRNDVWNHSHNTVSNLLSIKTFMYIFYLKVLNAANPSSNCSILLLLICQVHP